MVLVFKVNERRVCDEVRFLLRHQKVGLGEAFDFFVELVRLLIDLLFDCLVIGYDQLLVRSVWLVPFVQVRRTHS